MVLMIARIGLGQLDLLAVDMVDRADMLAVRTDDLHMLLDAQLLEHADFLLDIARSERAAAEPDAVKKPIGVIARVDRPAVRRPKPAI
jgi:hypothetical protein